MRRIFFLLLPLSFLIAACGTIESETKYPTGADRASTEGDIYAEPPSIFGAGGIAGALGRSNRDDDGATIGVNSYLWRASLDTISFMPIDQADPFGGVITTDWYTPPGQEGERLKLNVFILSKKLQSDGIRVRVFKQEVRGNSWQDVPAAESTARDLEDAILTRARQLRVGGLAP